MPVLHSSVFSLPSPINHQVLIFLYDFSHLPISLLLSTFPWFRPSALIWVITWLLTYLPAIHATAPPYIIKTKVWMIFFKSKSDLTVEYCNLTHSHMQTKCCCSVNHVQLCDPMDCGTPGFPVLHNFLKFAQTRVYWIGDAIQPSHPLSPPSPPALNLSQHQSLFQWAGSSHQVTKVLELLLHHQSFQ